MVIQEKDVKVVFLQDFGEDTHRLESPFTAAVHEDDWAAASLGADIVQDGLELNSVRIGTEYAVRNAIYVIVSYSYGCH